MGRGVITPIPLDDIPDDYVETANMMSRLVGDATTIQVLAHSMPSTDFYFQTFYKQMFYNERPGLKVSVNDKQLVRLRLSKRHGCALCNRSNEEEVRSLGFQEAQIDALFEIDPEPGLFTDAQLALIAFTDQMILQNQDGILDAELYGRMRRHFSDEQIVEVALVTAVLVGAAKMTFVLDIVPRDAVCEMVRPAPALKMAS